MKVGEGEDGGLEELVLQSCSSFALYTIPGSVWPDIDRASLSRVSADTVGPTVRATGHDR